MEPACIFLTASLANASSEMILDVIKKTSQVSETCEVYSETL
jgi:hypothetical protein